LRITTQIIILFVPCENIHVQKFVNSLVVQNKKTRGLGGIVALMQHLADLQHGAEVSVPKRHVAQSRLGRQALMGFVAETHRSAAPTDFHVIRLLEAPVAFDHVALHLRLQAIFETLHCEVTMSRSTER